MNICITSMQLKHLWNNVLQVVYLPAFKLANPVIPFSTLPQYPTRMMWIVTSIAYCLLYLMETWPTAWTLTGSEQMVIISSHLICPLTARIVGAPPIISQPVVYILPCSPLSSGTWRTPGLSIPWCCLPACSSVCLVFFPLSLCLARWFWPDMMKVRHDNTTAVCVSLPWSGGIHVVRLPVGSWHGLPRW